MKVLIVNYFDIKGGAARAAYRLHHALLDINVDSRMLVLVKDSDDATVSGARSFVSRSIKKCRFPLDQIPVRKYDNSTLFSPSWVPSPGVVDKINSMKPDIVHLHWIVRGMLGIEDLARIKAPIVWSLHDMWPFTGGCHYDEECGAYSASCGKCKVLRSDDEKDLSRRVHNRKASTYASINSLTIVGLSHWIAECASRSSLFAGRNIKTIPNPIDVEQFSPMDRRAARTHFKLPADRKIVLYGAMNATSEPRKGYAELRASLARINPQDAELVVFGSDSNNNHEMCAIRTHFVGDLTDDATLQRLYCAADVMVAPSTQENLSNIIMEALSCGTPVVAFDTGGNRDMVDHQVNGYLARPFDTADFATGIEWVLNSTSPGTLSAAARTRVLENFEPAHVARQYLDLYKELVAQVKPGMDGRPCQATRP